MRFAVLGSVALHLLVLGAMLRLRAPGRTPSPVEIEILKPPAVPRPEPPAAKAPVPKRQAVAAPHPTAPAHRPRPAESAPIARPALPAPPESTHPGRPPGPVDLTLHGLPAGVSAEVALAPGKDSRPGPPGDPVDDGIADLNAGEFELSAHGRHGYSYAGHGFAARIAPDGSVRFDDNPPIALNGLGASFDITEMIMNARGEDPHRYWKQKFLTATEALRTRLGARERSARAEHSVAMLPRALLALWSTPQPARARRLLLYQMWKDAAPSEPALAHAAGEARRLIVSFIRHHLPRGSADAFTDAELAAYHFDPYDDEPQAPTSSN